MGQRFQARQPEKAASALDGVDQAKDVIENLRVVRILLEPNQLIIDRIQTFAGFRQEFPQQIVHMKLAFTQGRATSPRLSEFGQLLCKGFNIG
jgi:hypothetical protein